VKLPGARTNFASCTVDRPSLSTPITTALPPDASPLDRVKILKRRVQAGLQKVGINVASDESQAQIEAVAYIGTLGTRRSYFRSLKALPVTWH